MIDPDKLKNDLVSYITSFSPSRDRVFTVRDFNSQVMAQSFDAGARDGLKAVLDDLVASGVLDRRSPTDYALSEKGVGFVRARRAARSDA